MLAVVFGTDNISLETYIHAHGSSFDGMSSKKRLTMIHLADYYWVKLKGNTTIKTIVLHLWFLVGSIQH
jgi:hypothetical protein